MVAVQEVAKSRWLPLAVLWARVLLLIHCNAVNLPPSAYQRQPSPAFGYDPYQAGRGGPEAGYYPLGGYQYQAPARQQQNLQPPGSFQRYAYPYPYTYDYPPPPPPDEAPKLPEHQWVPEPYLPKAYDYTKDFLRSLESIEELKDPAVRTALASLKKLEPSHPSSLFGDQEIKVQLPPFPSVNCMVLLPLIY